MLQYHNERAFGQLVHRQPKQHVQLLEDDHCEIKHSILYAFFCSIFFSFFLFLFFFFSHMIGEFDDAVQFKEFYDLEDDPYEQYNIRRDTTGSMKRGKKRRGGEGERGSFDSKYMLHGNLHRLWHH
jgi:hypothetical protein